MAVELHLDVELLAPATVFFVQRLKSNLGEVLMLMLSSFLRVLRVSVLVCGVAAAVMVLLVTSYLCATRWLLHRLTLPPSGLAAGESSLPCRRPWP